MADNDQEGDDYDYYDYYDSQTPSKMDSCKNSFYKSKSKKMGTREGSFNLKKSPIEKLGTLETQQSKLFTIKGSILKEAQEEINDDQSFFNPNAHLPPQPQAPPPVIFGTKDRIEYKYHKKPIKQSLINFNSKLYATVDNKNVHFWSIQNGSKIKHFALPELLKSHAQASTFAYSHKFRIYLLITKDFKLYFYNDAFCLIRTIDLSIIRLVNFAEFYDEGSKLVMAGIDGVFIFDFIYTSKYSPAQTALIDAEGRHVKVDITNKVGMEKMLTWVKGMKFDYDNDLIITWSETEVNFNCISENFGKIKLRSKNLMKDSITITEVMINKKTHYFLTGTSGGQIMVWKFQKEKKNIHIYSGHHKEVTSLVEYPRDDRLFFSASPDGTIRLWSLDKFQEVYVFEVPNLVKYIKIFDNCEKVMIGTKQSVYIKSILFNVDNFLNQDQILVKIKKGYQDREYQNINQTNLVFSLASDTSVYIQDPEKSIIKSTIYPPPVTQKVIDLVYSIKLQRIIVLLETGALHIYNYNQITAKIEKILLLSQLKDSDGRHAADNVALSLNLIQTQTFQEIYCLDQETFNEKNHCEDIHNVFKDQLNQDQEFLLLGMSKGSVMLLNVLKIELIFGRITVHKSGITHNCYLGNTQTFITLDQMMNLHVWQIDEENKKVDFLFRGNIQRPILYMKPLSQVDESERVLIGFECGALELFEIKHKRILYLQQPYSFGYEHEDDLTSVDYFQNRNLLVTSCKEGIIKLWNRDLQLIREIKFPKQVDAVVFINERADILVSHEGKLSLMQFSTFFPKDYIESSFKMERRALSNKVFQSIKEKIDQLKANNKVQDQQQLPTQDESEESDHDQPPTPLTLKAEAFFNSIQTKEEVKETTLNPMKKTRHNTSLDSRINDSQQNLHYRKKTRLYHERDRSFGQQINLEELNPYKYTALPPLKVDQTLQNIVKRSPNNKRSGRFTRRDITQYKISLSILQYNNQVPIKDYETLRLGPIRTFQKQTRLKPIDFSGSHPSMSQTRVQVSPSPDLVQGEQDELNLKQSINTRVPRLQSIPERDPMDDTQYIFHEPSNAEIKQGLNSHKVSISNEVKELIHKHKLGIGRGTRKERNEANPFTKRNLNLKTLRTPKVDDNSISTQEHSIMLLKGHRKDLSEMTPSSNMKGSFR